MRGIQKDSLPAVYKHQKNAWMDSKIFTEYRLWLDQQMTCPTLLLVDNCSAHNLIESTQFKYLRVERLPPNITSVLRPNDAGIIKNVKLFYRKKLIQKYLVAMENGTLHTLKIDVLEALKMAAQAYEQISQATIANCWIHTGIVPTANLLLPTKEEIGAVDLLNLMTALSEEFYFPKLLSPEEYVSIDDHLEVCSSSHVEVEDEIENEIIQMISPPSTAPQDEDEDEDENEDEVLIPRWTMKNAQRALQAASFLHSFLQIVPLNHIQQEDVVYSKNLVKKNSKI